MPPTTLNSEEPHISPFQQHENHLTALFRMNHHLLSIRLFFPLYLYTADYQCTLE